MKVYFRKQLLASLVSVITLTSVPIDHAQAIAYRYDIAGYIDRMFDTTGLLTDVDIVPSVSTFTGSFTYEPTPTQSSQMADDLSYYIMDGSFSLSIDDRYDLSADSERGDFFDASVFNDRRDSDTFLYGAHLYGFTDEWGLPQGDSSSHINIWFKDTSSSVFSDTSLPQNINLLDYDRPQIIVQSNTEDSRLYKIFGVVTSLEETIISEQEPSEEDFFGPKNYREELPLGGLKVWTGSEYVSIFTPEGQAAFDPRKETEVLIHGWNGIGGNNTPLEEKWIAEEDGFTSLLDSNASKDTNILAFDWTEAANSRLQAIDNMIASDLQISPHQLNILRTVDSLYDDEVAKQVLAAGEYPELSAIFDEFQVRQSVWDTRIDDNWVPNEQVNRQALELARQLEYLLSSEDSGSVSFFGHSLGAGIAAKAIKELLTSSPFIDISRLTLFDPPEDRLALATSGRVLLDSDLADISRMSDQIVIDNYWSSAPLLGYGKSYTDAANIQTSNYTHSSIQNELYGSTIIYNQTSYYPYSSDIPYGIGYDDLTGTTTLSRVGTNCLVGSHFSGLDECRTTLGFSEVLESSRSITRPVFDFEIYLESGDAFVDFDPVTGLPILTSGSPVFTYVDDFYVFEGLTGIEVDYEWLTRFDDDAFRIWINDTLVYTLDGILARDGIMSTGLLDMLQWEGEFVRLTFGVLSDYAGSTLSIRDIRIVEIRDGSVPVPATIALMGLGLAGIGFARKKKHN